MRPPCKQGGRDCPMRRVGCQSRCEAYRAFQQSNKERYAQMQTDYMIREVLAGGFTGRAREFHKKLKAV